jgi:hypothetical protein
MHEIKMQKLKAELDSKEREQQLYLDIMRSEYDREH